MKNQPKRDNHIIEEIYHFSRDSSDFFHSHMGVWNENNKSLRVFHTDFYQGRLDMNQTAIIAGYLVKILIEV